MIALPYLDGAVIAVLGLGRSGRASALAAAKSGAEVLAWDDSAEARDTLAKEAALAGLSSLSLEDPSEGIWERARTLVLSPGIAYEHPSPHPLVAAARKSGQEVISDIELFARARLPAKVVAVTGTNGKSTTATLIAHILTNAGRKAELGGNIGRAVLAMEELEENGFYVLELSSYQLETTASLGAEVAILLNITPDHLERHGGLTGYRQAKQRIFSNAPREGVAVVGQDDEICADICKELAAEGLRSVIAISRSQVVARGVYRKDGWLIDDCDGKEEAVFDLSRAKSLPGDHNAENAAAAYTACRALGLTREEIAQGLASFSGLVHRQELVAMIGGIAYVNDSKATNPDAAARALACYRKIYWIAGGRAKDGGIEQLLPYLPRLAAAYLIGEAQDDFAKQLQGKVPVVLCGTLERAVKAANQDAANDLKARAGHNAAGAEPVVLFSPACASFDQFVDFEARGNRFRELVANLPGTAIEIEGGAA